VIGPRRGRAVPLIVEAAINGGTPKSRNPNVPRSVPEIVESACAAIEAGATVVHNHNDEPNLGGPARHRSEPYAEAWREVLRRHPGVVLYPTIAGGGPHTTIEERNQHQVELADAGLLRLVLIDPGTVNVGGTGADGPQGGDLVYQTTFGDVRHLMAFARERGLAPTMSIYEPGFLQLALAYERSGLLPPGGVVRLYFCGGGPFLGGASFVFGLPPTLPALEAYLDMLEGSRLSWMVAVLGGDVVGSGMAELAISRGGHVRVGLEDYSGPGPPTNTELVAQVAELAARAGRALATREETAEILLGQSG
jgi:3-keto-5-aminohexanoate cleavage enzyme